MLHKAIFHGKEKRKQYRGAKAACYACCNHRSCVRCAEGRQFTFKKNRFQKADSSEEDV